MNILVDMNLSPEWVEVLKREGFGAVHWTSIGDPRASDHVLLGWARSNDHVVFTADLDFGTILAATGAASPSVVQLRANDTLPDAVGAALIAALRQFEPQLTSGALLVIDPARNRVRLLPI